MLGPWLPADLCRGFGPAVARAAQQLPKSINSPTIYWHKEHQTSNLTLQIAMAAVAMPPRPSTSGEWHVDFAPKTRVNSVWMYAVLCGFVFSTFQVFPSSRWKKICQTHHGAEGSPARPDFETIPPINAQQSPAWWFACLKLRYPQIHQYWSSHVFQCFFPGNVNINHYKSTVYPHFWTNPSLMILMIFVDMFQQSIPLAADSRPSTSGERRQDVGTTVLFLFWGRT